MTNRADVVIARFPFVEMAGSKVAKLAQDCQLANLDQRLEILAFASQGCQVCH